MLAPSVSQPPLDRLRRLLPATAAWPRATAAGHWATSLPAALRWLARGRPERLVLFLPLLLLPTVGAARDLVLLATVFLLVTVIEAGLQPAAARPNDKTGLAVGALAWLVAGLVLGTGTALTLALFVLLRAIETRAPEALWPIRLGLAALVTALLLDLALVALALERSSVWLALAAAIGAASAAARCLDNLAGEPAAALPEASAAGPRVWLETALIAAGCLVLALYATLLAHEPALAQLAEKGRFLALPFLAAALGRLCWCGLENRGPRRADPLAVLLLAAWALTAVVLGSPAAVV